MKNHYEVWQGNCDIELDEEFVATFDDLKAAFRAAREIQYANNGKYWAHVRDMNDGGKALPMPNPILLIRQEVVDHRRQWDKLGGRSGTNQRFGQWWWNNYSSRTNKQSDPTLFYMENTYKAMNYIIQHYVEN